jgi:beta-barrel assembly-enhancing protease
MPAIRRNLAVAMLGLGGYVVAAAAQTQIVAPKNKYSPADDVKVGLQAARQVEQQLPIMHDEQVNGYLNRIGQRLVENIPPEFQHPEFHYTFTGVNVREINAFALPGGPMFINRGMIEKAHNEGEVAGVMAHELSHVALRHGTAQQTKAQKFEIGQVLGQVAGSIVGGGLGQVISTGSQVGMGGWFLHYSRDYEKQADLLGSHIMASAGYDPRDMANVFKTIQQEGGSGAPQWMSDHPDPGNRYEYINQEAQSLTIGAPPPDSGEFQNVRAYLARMSPAPSTEEATKNRRAGRTSTSPANLPDRSPDPSIVRPPDTRSTSYNEGTLFRVSVPSNWRELPGSNSVTFAPYGAYGTLHNTTIFTHGVEIGIARNETHDLKTATDELLQSLRQGNPQLSRPDGYEPASIDGRQALHAVLSNVSDVNGAPEVIEVYTTRLSDGTLFYALAVAPRDQYAGYSRAFANVAASIQFTR